MAGSIEKTQEKKIILYLYLLHHPDHGYAIAKEFLEARKNGNWTKKKYSDLTNYKIYTTLKEMHREETIKTEKKDRTNIYKPNPTHITKQKNKETLTEFLEVFTEYIAKTSPDKQRCIKEINSIKKYDDLTILCYIKKLIKESLDQIPERGTTPSNELDEIMMLSGEISKTKKTPTLLKTMTAEDTLSFFRNETRKRNIPLNIENYAALRRTLEDTLKKIDEAIITHSYTERIPAKQ